MTSIPLGDMESSGSAKFDAIGDKHAGTIIAIKQTHQTAMDGTLKRFQSGDPIPIWLITIEPDAGDAVTLWAKGGKYDIATGSGQSMLSAIATAVRQSGAKSVEVGAKLAVAFTGLSTKKGSQPQPAKLYTAQYVAPAAEPASVPVDLFTTPES